jgi:hypothetical protein
LCRWESHKSRKEREVSKTTEATGSKAMARMSNLAFFSLANFRDGHLLSVGALKSTSHSSLAILYDFPREVFTV